MLFSSALFSTVIAATIGVQTIPQMGKDLSYFGVVLNKDRVTVEDEIRAASDLSDYIDAINEVVPTPEPDDISWFRAELSSRNLERVGHALSKPEGCFAAYKETSAELIKYLDLIASLDPQKLSLVNDRAPEDKIWIWVVAKLSNPLVSDILNCPSKHLTGVSQFDPVNRIETRDGDLVIRVVIHAILTKFVLEDARFFGSSDNN